jgi:predicted DNA binding CopG/RHH family protein
MRQVIDGVPYDTRRAIPVAQVSNNPLDQEAGWLATLYYAPFGGRWFLSGEGGPRTEFAGARIVPVTPARARQLLEDARQTTALEEFAEVLGIVNVEEPRDRVIRFRLSGAELAHIRRRAEEDGLTMSQFLRRCVNQAAP